jgi:hypothetical protein
VSAKGVGAVPPRIRNSTTNHGGAPKGNRNALKHGYHTTAAKRRRAEARMLLQAVNAALALLAERSAELPPVAHRVTRHAADCSGDRSR